MAVFSLETLYSLGSTRRLPLNSALGEREQNSRQYSTMKKYQIVKFDPSVSLTLRELRERQNLNTVQMAALFGISREEYSRAENGRPPAWMVKAIRFFEALFAAGYLPNQIDLPTLPRDAMAAETSGEYRTD